MAPVPLTFYQQQQLQPGMAEEHGGVFHGYGTFLLLLILFHVAAFVYWLYLLVRSNYLARNSSTEGSKSKESAAAYDWIPKVRHPRLFQQLKIPGFAKPSTH